MIRQARIYLAGAVSGTTLVVAAVVGFVVLVSLQSLQEWPLTGLRVGGHEASGGAAIAPGRPAAEGTGGGGRGGTTATTGNGAAGPASGAQSGGGIDTATTTPSPPGPTGAAPGSGQPATGTVERASTVSPGESTSHSGGSGNSAGSGNTGSGDTGSGNTGSGNTGNAGSHLTEAATGTVDQATSGVDAAAAKLEDETGIVGAAEEIVHSAVGPNPRALPKATEAVDGLLGGNG